MTTINLIAQVGRINVRHADIYRVSHMGEIEGYEVMFYEKGAYLHDTDYLTGCREEADIVARQFTCNA